MIILFKYLKDCHIEDGAELFSVAPEGQTRTNRLKLIQKNFRLNIQKWNRLPQEVVDSPSLEVFKQRLDRHLTEMLFL